MTATLDRRIATHIRWMIRRDMPEVQDIEDRSFPCAWTEEEFIKCLRQRNCIGVVAEYAERVVGFMVYELHKNRLHLLSLAVHPDFRHKGVGTAMIGKLVGKLSSQRRRTILCEVREGNLVALNWLKSLGFRAEGVLRDFYDDWSTEDAILMQYRLERG